MDDWDWDWDWDIDDDDAKDWGPWEDWDGITMLQM